MTINIFTSRFLSSWKNWQHKTDQMHRHILHFDNHFSTFQSSIRQCFRFLCVWNRFVYMCNFEKHTCSRNDILGFPSKTGNKKKNVWAITNSSNLDKERKHFSYSHACFFQSRWQNLAMYSQCNCFQKNCRKSITFNAWKGTMNNWGKLFLSN